MAPGFCCLEQPAGVISRLCHGGPAPSRQVLSRPPVRKYQKGMENPSLRPRPSPTRTSPFNENGNCSQSLVRPSAIEHELLSSWLRRVAANFVSFSELLQGFEAGYGGHLFGPSLDHSLSEPFVNALSRFCQ